jgi:hypothetical protein
MCQVYIFKNTTVNEAREFVEITIPCLAYDGRDVHIICTGAKSLTNFNVMLYIYMKHYLPFMEGERSRRGLGTRHSILNMQDGDPVNIQVLDAIEGICEEAAKNVVVPVDSWCHYFVVSFLFYVASYCCLEWCRMRVPNPRTASRGR